MQNKYLPLSFCYYRRIGTTSLRRFGMCSFLWANSVVGWCSSVHSDETKRKSPIQTKSYNRKLLFNIWLPKWPLFTRAAFSQNLSFQMWMFFWLVTTILCSKTHLHRQPTSKSNVRTAGTQQNHPSASVVLFTLSVLLFFNDYHTIFQTALGVKTLGMILSSIWERHLTQN